MTIKGVEGLASAVAAARTARDGKAARVSVCTGSGCLAKGAAAVKDALSQAGLPAGECSCNGFCEKGPVVTVEPAGLLYCGVKAGDAGDIAAGVKAGGPVERLGHRDPAARKRFPRAADLPWFATQARVVLARAGRLEPGDLDAALALSAYEGAARALCTMTPEAVIEEVEKSGLRGRGGAGFPAGAKWRACREAEGDGKYVVCNGGVLLEIDPHGVLEGMLIAAFAVGAHEGLVHLREEQVAAIAATNRAIAEATKRGLLGDDVLGTGFAFRVRVARGGGEFVAGESTAVLAAIAGGPPEPRPKMPRSAVAGLFGKPTLLSNMETFAQAAAVLARGWPEFRRVGTHESPGTKVFSLGGKVKDGGLVEVPFGTTLRQIVLGIGGGVARDRDLKAVLVGGPTGGLLPASALDLPLTYESVAEAGAVVGNGNLMVLDGFTCVVDVARYFTRFLADESCGKCTPCREGFVAMGDLLDRIVLGEAAERDLDSLESLAKVVAAASLCGLGKTGPNVVLSGLRYFREEFLAHVREERCPAGVCPEVTTLVVREDLCEGCQACRKACPTGAISGEKKQVHRIDPEVCTVCGACRNVCRFDAIVSK